MTGTRRHAVSKYLGCILSASLVFIAHPIAAEQPGNIETSLHGFPAMLNLQGAKLADGEFVQWTENGVLHITIDYNFPDDRHIQENASLRQEPALVQEAWSWSESRHEERLRHFEVDFKSGKAIAEKRDGQKIKRWTENLKIEPGRTFAGFAFVLVCKRDRERLIGGAKSELQAVGFTPKPRVVSVQISHGGLDQMSMAGRMVKGDCFVIHPQVPAIAKMFVEVQDSRIWLTTPPATGFLRWEGPLVESSDPPVRVDLLPGENSGPARPAQP
jgi:hypothetical protein